MDYHGLAVMCAVFTVGLSVGLVLIMLLILRDNRGRFTIKHAMALMGAIAIGMAAFRWIVTQ